mmetsp:Transcript_8520/g.17272  ORF Transcript_8520/g.17272 Transcript_8520/m.17272 type:complete len:229 (+) Transcript_8520:365-1051(+)
MYRCTPHLPAAVARTLARAKPLTCGYPSARCSRRACSPSSRPPPYQAATSPPPITRFSAAAASAAFCAASACCAATLAATICAHLKQWAARATYGRFSSLPPGVICITCCQHRPASCNSSSVRVIPSGGICHCGGISGIGQRMKARVCHERRSLPAMVHSSADNALSSRSLNHEGWCSLESLGTLSQKMALSIELAHRLVPCAFVAGVFVPGMHAPTPLSGKREAALT